MLHLHGEVFQEYQVLADQEKGSWTCTFSTFSSFDSEARQLLAATSAYLKDDDGHQRTCILSLFQIGKLATEQETAFASTADSMCPSCGQASNAGKLIAKLCQDKVGNPL